MIHFLESSELVQKSPCVLLNSEPTHRTPFRLLSIVCEGHSGENHRNGQSMVAQGWGWG